MPVITNLEDLRKIYHKRVPKMFVDYCESGSWTEQTLHDNSNDFDELRLRQKVAIDMTGRNASTNIIGTQASLPIALAPVGLTGMQSPDGEIKAAQAAEEYGVPYTLSTMSICSIEDVAENTNKPFWFQLYVMRDRDFSRRLIQRAKAAKCSALVITLDLQILGQRHADIKNGLSAPPKITVQNIINILMKQRWAWGMLNTKRRGFGNIVGHVDGVDDMSSLGSWTSSQFDQSLSWNDLEWIKNEWGGPIILKGILDADDAKQAVDVGADAIVVSNHGGRQLDGALSSIRALPNIADAVKGQTEIMIDGGIRSGQDVIKALALGADHVMIGRPYIYGLGAMGREGVLKTLEILQKEFDTTLAFCGGKSPSDLNEGNLYIPKNFDPRDAFR